MEGDRITNAKEAVKLFLHSLPAKSKFSIISFGGYVEYLSVGGNTILEHNEWNVRDALGQVDGFTADIGATNIELAMQSALDLDSHRLHKRVILLTDGEINRGGGTDVVVAQAKHDDIVVHTLGLSDGADAKLLEETAKAGRGTFSLIGDDESGNVLNEKVI